MITGKTYGTLLITFIDNLIFVYLWLVELTPILTNKKCVVVSYDKLLQSKFHLVRI